MPTSTTAPHIIYSPYDDRTQVAREIPRYHRSFTRNPSRPLVPRPVTLSEMTGPTGLAEKFGAGELDLSHAVSGGPRAIGQLMTLSGRVTDEDGRPLGGTVIELWQANACGKYVHKLDRYNAPLDPNFIGQGRLLTNAEGEFNLITIKPGCYPVMESDWWRAPHIHFSIFGPSWMNRYVTQIFFPGEPLNQTDLLLNGVADEEARQRLILKPCDAVGLDFYTALGFRVDFVLRGKSATPALDD
jgi:protocatechuate 3,4-dioxygenase, beta subunit